MKVLSENIVYSGKIFSMVQQQVQIGDIIKTFEIARRAPGTRLIIVNKQWDILLSKEYRTETKNYDIRLPWWKVFDTLSEYEWFLSSGNNIQEAATQWAIKEAKEEVWIVTSNIDFFAKSVSGSTVMWDLYYFVVREYSQEKQSLEEGEDISFGFYTPEVVKRMCLDWTIQEDRSAMMLMKFLHQSNSSL